MYYHYKENYCLDQLVEDLQLSPPSLKFLNAPFHILPVIETWSRFSVDWVKWNENEVYPYFTGCRTKKFITAIGINHNW